MHAGVELIGERGFADVTVGDIEEAAGFVRRGGTLYKHFASKHDLLVQAMQHHIDTLDRHDGLDGFTELPDLRSELIVLAKWVLSRLSREETISKVIEKEGHRLPDLVTSMRDGISETGYAMTSAYLTDRGLAPDADADAVAVLLLGGLVNLRRSTWTFGAEPAGISDDRAITAWADIVLGVLRPTGLEPRR
jgi:AcrR family transcriptional regulator